MASRKLTFDASKSSGRSLGASPAARNILATTSQQHPFMSPTRSLATPTRPSQRATLARMQQARRDLAALGSPAQSTPVTRSTGIARRNPLQAITKREQQRSNLQHGNTGNEHANQKLTRSNENAVSTATAHAALTPDQQRQQKARVAEWIYAYRRAFPSFVFYFEGIDESTVRRLSVPVRSLGAKVETFFSAQTVTHVVVESPAMASDENASKSSHVVSLAKRFHLKIWDLDKLENRVLMFLLPGYSASNTQSPSVLSAKRKLNEAFSAEKMYAMRHKAFEGNSVAHCVDFYHFKYFYVLVEDAAHLHRPAIVEDFRPPEPGRDPPWPKLYMVPAGRCPFVQYEDPTTSSKGSESDGEENKENATPEPEATTLPTMQLLSKTPASRRQTPRRKAWTPTATRTGAECISGNGKPSATVQTSRTHEAEALTAAANDADFVTPTRPPRSNAAPLFGATAAAGKSGDVSRQMDASIAMDSNASGVAQSRGVTSTSTAFHLNTADPALQQNLLQNLNGGRVTQLSRLEQPVASPRIAGGSKRTRTGGRVPPVPRTKKPRVPARRPMVARPGYCENCRVKYEDMLEHIATPQHRRFAGDERNWIQLDSLLENVRRPLRKPDAAPENAVSHGLYALSSDDTGDAVPANCSSALPLHIRHAAAAVAAASAPPSLAGNWGSSPFATNPFGNGFTSNQLLASGRLSTETIEGAVCANSGAFGAARSHTTNNVIDLTFSATNTNSSCPSPKQPAEGDGGNNSLGDARPPQTASASLCAAVHSANIVPITPTPQRLGTADSSIASLISSLETPKFQAAVAARTSYDDGATLFGEGFDYHSRQRSTLDSQYSFQTPTRPSFQHLSRDLAAAAEASSGRTPVDGISATADHSGFLQEPIGGSTLIQPSRAVSKLGTTAGGKKAGANAEYLRHEVNEETQATN